MTLIREAYNDTETIQFPWENWEQEAINYANEHDMLTREVEMTEWTPTIFPDFVYHAWRQQTCVHDTSSISNQWTDIAEYTIPSQMLRNDGDTVSKRVVWQFATNSNGKTIQVLAWETVVYDTTELQHVWGDREIVANVIKSDTKIKVIVNATTWYPAEILTNDMKYTEISDIGFNDEIKITVRAKWINDGDIQRKCMFATLQKWTL